MIIADEIDEEFLEDLQEKDKIFPNVDYNIYA